MSNKFCMKEAAAKIRRRLKDRERRFQKMAPHRKRIAIAKDVIMQTMVGGLIRPKAGVYLTLKGDTSIVGPCAPDSSKKIELVDALNDGKVTGCTACALGSMLVCTALRRDNVSVAAAEACFGKSIGKELSDFFHIEQIEMIECAFERSYMHAHYDRMYSTPIMNAIKFGAKYRWPGQRLRAIMQNIIDNDGTFIP